jgi:hypothetical protein
MSSHTQHQDRLQPFQPEIRRARLDTLTIYEVSDSELKLLEQGSPDSILLNFSVFLLSSAISFTITLFSTTIQPDRTYMCFVLSTIVGYVVGFLLLLLWWRSRKSVSKTVDEIRKRLPPEGESELLFDTTTRPE